MNRERFVFLSVLLLVVILAYAVVGDYRDDVEELQEEATGWQEVAAERGNEVHAKRQEIEGLYRTLNWKKESLEEQQSGYEVRQMNITKYAPLDPEAESGWDYSGDPNVTASGEQVVPGHTVAAGSNIPFGTRVYIEGIGWRVVQDRGGYIGYNDIDVAVDTKAESSAWGKRSRFVVIEWDRGYRRE